MNLIVAILQGAAIGILAAAVLASAALGILAIIERGQK